MPRGIRRFLQLSPAASGVDMLASSRFCSNAHGRPGRRASLLIAGMLAVSASQPLRSAAKAATSPCWDNVFVHDFGEDFAGELYVLASKKGIPFEETGLVMRIVPPVRRGRRLPGLSRRERPTQAPFGGDADAAHLREAGDRLHRNAATAAAVIAPRAARSAPGASEADKKVDRGGQSSPADVVVVWVPDLHTQ